MEKDLLAVALQLLLLAIFYGIGMISIKNKCDKLEKEIKWLKDKIK